MGMVGRSMRRQGKVRATAATAPARTSRSAARGQKSPGLKGAFVDQDMEAECARFRVWASAGKRLGRSLSPGDRLADCPGAIHRVLHRGDWRWWWWW